MSDLTDEPRYEVTDDEREAFHRDGFVHLPGVLTEEEVLEIEAVYDRLIRGDVPIPGRDFCDMAGSYQRSPESFSLINVMLPRRYLPSWGGNVYERRAHDIAEQLVGNDLLLDYDQLLAKPPGKEDAVFPWHQDLAYWFETEDPRTASFWLALDNATVQNGCMRFVPGSHREPTLRPHRPVLGDRGESHALAATLRDDDVVYQAEIKRGDCTVHHERVLHGSGGNLSLDWRRAYIIAFRSRTTVEAERELGFTHSHNDAPEVLARVAAMKRPR
jgi:hypothetical protein